MLNYLTLGTNDLARATPFYDALLATLGHVRRHADDREIGYSPEEDPKIRFWVVTPFNEKPATPGNGTMIAFDARTRATVDAFHAAGLAHGGSGEGNPGLRPYGPDFYSCYLRDLDGNKLSAVCRAAE